MTQSTISIKKTAIQMMTQLKLKLPLLKIKKRKKRYIKKSFRIHDQNILFYCAQKKNKKQTEEKEAQPTSSNSFQFVSTDIPEDKLEDLSQTSPKANFINANVKRLFQIQPKYLNSDNEMIRMFGAKIVQSERNK